MKPLEFATDMTGRFGADSAKGRYYLKVNRTSIDVSFCANKLQSFDFSRDSWDTYLAAMAKAKQLCNNHNINY